MRDRTTGVRCATAEGTARYLARFAAYRDAGRVTPVGRGARDEYLRLDQ